MNDLLEAILKAGAASAIQKQTQGRSAQADPMADLIGGILGGGGAQQRRAAPAMPQQGDPMADLIGGILGGGSRSQAAPAMPQGGGLPIEDLIGSLIGGNASQGQPHQNGIADMIGAIMGGGSGRGVNPIAQIIAQKTGLPPMLAQAAVAFFMAKMFGNQMQRQAQPVMPSPSGGGGSILDSIGDMFKPGNQAQEDDSLDLDDLLDSMGDENALGARFQNSGMASELAEKTGMSSDQANQALREILKVVGQTRQQPRPVNPRESKLESLLDAWD